MKSVLELSIFIFLAKVGLRYILGLSQLFLSALLDYFVGQTEPKILRLVWDDCV